MRTPVRRQLAAVAAATLLGLGTSGCGDAPPAEVVPALGTALEQVDEAIVAGELGRAREGLDEIEQETRTALEDETLSDADAGRILAAVAALRDALAAARGRTEPEPQSDQPEDEPETEAPPGEPILPELTDPDEGEGAGEGEGNGNGKDEEKKEEKEKDKEEKDDKDE